MKSLAKKIEDFLDSTSDKEVDVAQVINGLELQEDDRRRVVGLLKSMPEDKGKFITGRRGYPSRFLKSQAAKGLDNGISVVASQKVVSEDQGLFEHQYLLRSNQLAKLALPIDLTTDEAERLSTFIRSLPIQKAKEEKRDGL